MNASAGRLGGSLKFTRIALAAGFSLALALPGQAEEKIASASPLTAPATAAGSNDNAGAVFYDANGKLVLKAHVKKNKLAKGKKGDEVKTRKKARC